MTPPPALAVALFVLIALAGAGPGFAAEKPPPQELWELYPLDPTGGAPREQPASTTTTTGAATGETPPATTAAAPPSPAPRGGVAGTSTTRPSDNPATARDADDDRSALSFGVILGALAASIILLGLAALPLAAAPRRVGPLVEERRVALAIAGTLTLLVMTVVYLTTS